MADPFDPRHNRANQPTNDQFFDLGAGQSVPRAEFDAGLRSHMLSIYNYMASAVLLSGIVAMMFVSSGYAGPIMFGPGIFKYVIMFAPLGFVFAMSFGINKMSHGTLQILYWAFAVTMGLSLSTALMVYTGESVALAFFSAAAAFAGLSLWGYTAKKDISGWGSFLIMGVIGLIVASILNMFMQSGTMNFVISILGVLIFAGLTAYDTQKLKVQYAMVAGTNFQGKAIIMGALNLYLDFINMFMFLLQLLGNRE